MMPVYTHVRRKALQERKRESWILRLTVSRSKVMDYFNESLRLIFHDLFFVPLSTVLLRRRAQGLNSVKIAFGTNCVSLT